MRTPLNNRANKPTVNITTRYQNKEPVICKFTCDSDEIAEDMTERIMTAAFIRDVKEDCPFTELMEGRGNE